MKISTLCLVTSALFTLVACQEHEEIEAPTLDSAVKVEKTHTLQNMKVTAESISTQKQQLESLTADKSCSSSTQCQVVAVGDRACGGPSQYLVYSTEQANTDTVKKLAAEITQAEKSYNTINDMMSICQHLTQPSAQCQANACSATKTSAPAY